MDQDDDALGIEYGHQDYTAEDLLEQAQANLQAFVLVTAAFLDGRGVSRAEWSATIGQAFARAWSGAQEWDAATLMDAMLTNLRAFGATVEQVTFDRDLSTAITAGIPDEELSTALGVDSALATTLYDVIVALAGTLGFRWSWSVEDGRAHHVVVRDSR